MKVDTITQLDSHLQAKEIDQQALESMVAIDSRTVTEGDIKRQAATLSHIRGTDTAHSLTEKAEKLLMVGTTTQVETWVERQAPKSC